MGDKKANTFGIEYIYEKYGKLSIQLELLTDELARTRVALKAVAAERDEAHKKLNELQKDCEE